MSLLTMIQSATPRIGIPKPQLIAGSTDDQVLQLMGIANEEGSELSRRYAWQALTKEGSFTTVATESQGSITTIAGSDFRYVINETIWNRTQRRPVFGPKSSQQWQQLKAQQINGPWYQYRIRGNLIIFIPVPTAGESCYFEWVSKNFVTLASGGTSATWVADGDTGLLDEDLMSAGIIWRWKQIKGLEYAEDFAKYERMVEDAMARDGSKPRLSLGGGGSELYYPGVIVPSGNWVV